MDTSIYVSYTINYALFSVFITNYKILCEFRIGTGNPYLVLWLGTDLTKDEIFPFPESARDFSVFSKHPYQLDSPSILQSNENQKIFSQT
jgi:hypothetical protein